MDFLWIYGLLFLVLLLFSIVVANKAEEYGKSSTGYFLFSFFLSPLLAYIVLLISGPKLSPEEVKQIIQPENDSVLENEQLHSEINKSKYDQLEQLGRLYEKGILNEIEFKAEKEKILNPNRTKFENSTPKLNEVISYIKEANKFGFVGPHEELIQTLKSEMTDKNNSIAYIKEYQSKIKRDLVEDLKGLSTNYDRIKLYLKPFIDFNIVAPEYPHERI